jgi:hypothetical protein
VNQLPGELAHLCLFPSSLVNHLLGWVINSSTSSNDPFGVPKHVFEGLTISTKKGLFAKREMGQSLSVKLVVPSTFMID